MTEMAIKCTPGTEQQGLGSKHSLSSQESFDLLAQIAELQSTNTSRMRTKDRPRFYFLLGEARQCIKQGDLQGAGLAMASAKRLLGGSTNAVARAYYLGAALGLGLLAATAMCWIYQSNTSCAKCACDAFARACFCMGMGTLGAACSVIFRASALAMESGAGKVVLGFEAAARVLAGAMSGFVLYLVTRSNMVFSADAIQKAPFAGHLLFAFAAGYVERFIPSVAESLHNFGQDSDNKMPLEGDKSEQSTA